MIVMSFAQPFYWGILDIFNIQQELALRTTLLTTQRMKHTHRHIDRYTFADG